MKIITIDARSASLFFVSHRRKAALEHNGGRFLR